MANKNTPINGRLEELRQAMRERNIKAYIIPTSDNHNSEMIADFFKCREFMSGFTGSAGTLVVTLDEARLWVDGRYFLQAEKELKGTEIIKMEIGMPGTINLYDYIAEEMSYLTDNTYLGFDGKIITNDFMDNVEDALFKAKLDTEWIEEDIYIEEDLVGKIWEDRPPMPKEKAYMLPEERTGKSAKEKIADLRAWLLEETCDFQVLTKLDEIAWLTNLRGNDIEYTPFVLAYMVISAESALLFIDEDKIDKETKEKLSKNGIKLRNYDKFYTYIKNINYSKSKIHSYNEIFPRGKGNQDGRESSYMLGYLNNEIFWYEKKTPIVLWKACKNTVEIENNYTAHLKDGIAVTKFLYWLKNTIGKEEISELTIGEKLLDFRSEQEGFLEPSFATIVAYEENGAYVHYKAAEDDFKVLEARGLLLVDSGGHYIFGSTDLTRTIALGDITEKQKKDYTLVLKGMIRLSQAKFLYGATGQNLDILARGIMWQQGLDYRHGTGHGVGFIGNVHEDPNGFRWQKVDGIDDFAVFEEGMVTSNEPGLYFEGEYGIRIENELLCKKAEENEFGQFMEFETITLAPIDIDAIDLSIVEQSDKDWLNNYHKKVFEKISPNLSPEEQDWLKEATREI